MSKNKIEEMRERYESSISYKLYTYSWNIVNADDEIIDTITASVDDSKIAYEKMKFKYPKGYRYLKLVKVRKKGKSKGLSCDVELGSVGTTMKYGTILMTGGIVAYAMYKFNLFGGMKWLKGAFRDLRLAPETIAKWEDGEVGTRVDQVDKIFDVLKKKADNFNSEFGTLYNEWMPLKGKAVSSYGSQGYKKTFWEANKQYYFGVSTKKEKLMAEIDTFRTKALTALRSLQARKGFKIKGNWQVVDGLS